MTNYPYERWFGDGFAELDACEAAAIKAECDARADAFFAETIRLGLHPMQLGYVAEAVVVDPNGDAVLTLSQISESAGSASIADAEDRQWEARNRRRLHLIEKELAGSLVDVERRELSELQTSMAAELNAVAPLPFDRLDELERHLNAWASAERRSSRCLFVSTSRRSRRSTPPGSGSPSRS